MKISRFIIIPATIWSQNFDTYNYHFLEIKTFYTEEETSTILNHNVWALLHSSSHTHTHIQMQQHIENLQSRNANIEFGVFFNFTIQKVCIISIANEIPLSDETTLNQLPTMINV